MKTLFAYAAPIEGDSVAARLPEALRLGVGKCEASVSLVRRLASAPRPDLVIGFGVCGAYRDAATPVGLLELCLVESDTFADEGVATPEGFRSLRDLGLGSIGPFAADGAWNERAREWLPEARLVRAATVSTCGGTDALARDLAGRSNAAIETMEGAAIALACERLGLPWIQLRCVSNYTGDRERGEWRLDGAVARLKESVLALARRLE